MYLRRLPRYVPSINREFMNIFMNNLHEGDAICRMSRNKVIVCLKFDEFVISIRDGAGKVIHGKTMNLPHKCVLPAARLPPPLIGEVTPHLLSGELSVIRLRSIRSGAPG